MEKFVKRAIAMVVVLGVLLGDNYMFYAQAEESTGTEESTEPAEGTESTEPTEPEKVLKEDVVVVLDPGHGGSDSGAIRVINGITYCERDIVLKIAQYCKEELEKTPGVTVYLTRTDNVSPCMDRAQRISFATQRNANILVSLHINATGAVTTTSVSGALGYYPNGNYNLRMSEAGYALASNIVGSLPSVGLKNNGVTIRNSSDTKYPDGSVADYLGINYYSKLSGLPGVLIEHAFINNPNDVWNFLSTEEQLRQLGIADARGIINYFQTYEHAYEKPQGVWVQDNVGWWYNYYTGGYPANKWENIGGLWYWFDERGYMTTGWQYIDGKWYYMHSNGAMLTGWQYINKRWYYMDVNGAMLAGWQYVDGVWYFLEDSGAMATGWKYIDNVWYYMNESGAMQTGWQYINKRWYYMHSNGAMQTGWQYVDGVWYFLEDSGAMVTGWRFINNVWYYMNEGGAMQTGWQYIDGVWYFLEDSGAMAANTWIGSYYVNASGAWVK